MHNASSLHKNSNCLYCGNNPIPHFTGRVDAIIASTLNPLFEYTARTRIGSVLLKMAEQVLDILWKVLIGSRIIRFSANPEHAPTDRGRVLIDEAIARGWKMETARIFGRSLDVYRITFPSGRTLNFSGLPRLVIEDTAKTGWIDDKALMKKRLQEAGVSVSIGESFTDSERAREFFARGLKPMITKPRFGSRGRHTATHLYTLEDFDHAFAVARQLGRAVIVEEHLVGSVYRATMVDRKLAGVLAGDPPRVTGDGVHTIAELITIKNDSRHERVGAYTITPLTHRFLKRLGLTHDTILGAGETIDLSEKTGLSYGGNAREVTRETHPALRAELERAARIVDDPIIGFDFITPDVSAHPDTVRWGIIECNAVPFINLHHDPFEGEPVNVAGIFLDYIEKNLT